MHVCMYVRKYVWYTHILTYTHTQVYAFGWGRDGQLGLGTVTKEKKSPTLIKGLESVVSLAACGSHCVALDAVGHVWVWGHNMAGQVCVCDWFVCVTGLCVCV